MIKHLWWYETLDEDTAPALMQEMFDADADEQLVLHINCKTGGAIEWTYPLAELLLGNPGRVDTVVHYYAYSAACIVAACGSHRLAYPSAQFLWHGGYVPDSGGRHVEYKMVSQVEGQLQRAHEKRRRLCAIMAAVSNEGHEFWSDKALSEQEWRFGAEEALALGLIDEIRTHKT